MPRSYMKSPRRTYYLIGLCATLRKMVWKSESGQEEHDKCASFHSIDFLNNVYLDVDYFFNL